jgi:hypothetical protein
MPSCAPSLVVIVEQGLDRAALEQGLDRAALEPALAG